LAAGRSGRPSGPLGDDDRRVDLVGVQGLDVVAELLRPVRSGQQVQPERRPLLGSAPKPATEPLELNASTGAAPASPVPTAPQPSVVSKAVSAPLSLLEPGERIWANVPGAGYVGVGEVLEPEFQSTIS